MILYAAVLLFSFLGLALVYRYDLYEREPWYLLLLTMGLGYLSMWAVAWVESWTLARGADPVAIAAVAATHEEMARLMLVAFVAWAFGSEFNDPMDGIVYGSVAGLGMGVEEAFHFLAGGSSEALTLASLPVEFVRLLGHLIMGGITGFGVGMAWMRIPRWPLRLLGALLFSTFLHFAWDWIALSLPPSAIMTGWQTASAILLMTSGIMVYGSLVVVGSHWSKKSFAPGSTATLWGWPFNVLFERRGDEEEPE